MRSESKRRSYLGHLHPARGVKLFPVIKKTRYPIFIYSNLILLFLSMSFCLANFLDSVGNVPKVHLGDVEYQYN